MRAIVLSLPLLLMAVSACNDAGPDAAPRHEPAPTLAGEGAPASLPAEADEPSAIAPSSRPAAASPREIRLPAATEGVAPRALGQDGVLPLAAIMDIARGRVPGEVVDVDLDDDDGLLTYEVEILTSAGRKIEVLIAAQGGAILQVEED